MALYAQLALQRLHKWHVWYFIEISTGFPMDLHWYLNQISMEIDFHLYFIEFQLDFYWYFIEMSNGISLKFQLDF